MPIVDVTLVVADGDGLALQLARELADALGAALGCEPGRLWVRLHDLPAARYAENGAGLDAGELPVFVTLLHADPPQGEARTAEVRRVCETVARCTRRPPDRVHVEFAAPGRGRVAFGGELV